jgi:hypothetical protein
LRKPILLLNRHRKERVGKGRDPSPFYNVELKVQVFVTTTRSIYFKFSGHYNNTITYLPSNFNRIWPDVGADAAVWPCALDDLYGTCTKICLSGD